MRSRLFLFPALLLCWTAAAQNKPEASQQVDRGRHFFVNSPKGLPCATCHSMEDAGTAVGPDLRRLAAVVSPHNLVRTIEMMQTVFVQEVRTRDGRTFPGIQKQIEGSIVELWDLSRIPAVLLRLRQDEIISMKENRTWQHPPASADYNRRELADIIGYLKWSATGREKEVTPSDLK